LSYKAFDKKWNTTYEGQFFGARDPQGAALRRGMVAGIPGNGLLAKVDTHSIQLSGAISDDEVAHVFDLGLGTRGDETAAAHDAFGLPCASGVLIELEDPGRGRISPPIEKGDFASSSPETPNSQIILQTHSIPENGRHSGASFYVEPRIAGSIQLRVTWWVQDRDDRRHGDNVISVLDDRGRADSSFPMRQPILAMHTHGPETIEVWVEDDDPAGPKFMDHDDSGDAEPGNYLFKIRLDDPSGIFDDSEYPRIYLRWDSDQIDETHHDGYSNADWDGSWYVANEMIDGERLDHTLYWRALAYDDDADREGDRTAAWSPVFEGGIISRPSPLSSPNSVQASDGAYSGKVQINWDGVPGADSYEVFLAHAEEGPWTRIGNPSNTSFLDTAAQADTIYYYAVKACNSRGCSLLSEHDRGYSRGVLPPCVINLLGMGAVGLALLASISSWLRKNGRAPASLRPGQGKIRS
jgi:hypothetical protein